MGSKTNQPNSEFYQEKFGFNHEKLVNQLGNLVSEGSVFMPYPKVGPPETYPPPKPCFNPQESF
jgi:hypothetical protein